MLWIAICRKQARSERMEMSEFRVVGVEVAWIQFNKEWKVLGWKGRVYVGNGFFQDPIFSILKI